MTIKLKTSLRTKVAKATKLTTKAVKTLVNFINDDYTSLPIAERELMFRDELQSLMGKYAIGLSIAIIDQKTETLPVIQA